jgi:hypothetical protein
MDQRQFGFGGWAIYPERFSGESFVSRTTTSDGYRRKSLMEFSVTVAGCIKKTPC